MVAFWKFRYKVKGRLPFEVRLFGRPYRDKIQRRTTMLDSKMGKFTNLNHKVKRKPYLLPDSLKVCTRIE